jgi:hypothetical protein
MLYYVYFLKNSLDNTIFYVGKGQNNRMYSHYVISKKNSNKHLKNPHLYNKIAKIYQSGGKIIYDKIFESTDEKIVLEKEKFYISEIGTYYPIEGIKNGILLNLTKGGEGTSGFKLSEETKKKMSESKKGKKRKPMSEETKIKLSESYKKKW